MTFKITIANQKPFTRTFSGEQHAERYVKALVALTGKKVTSAIKVSQ